MSMIDQTSAILNIGITEKNAGFSSGSRSFTDNAWCIVGGIQISPKTTLADVRNLIDEELEIPFAGQGSDSFQHWQFVFQGAPVSRIQENRRLGWAVLPEILVVPNSGNGKASASNSTSTKNTTTSGSKWSERSTPAGNPKSSQIADGGEIFPTYGFEEILIPPSSHTESNIENAATDAQHGSGTGTVVQPDLDLVCLDGPLEEQVLKAPATIGRHTQNDIVVPEAGISRYHSEIRWIKPSTSVTEKFCVRDAGSTTGTFLYLKPQVPFVMFKGLLLKMGESEICVVELTDEHCDLLFYEGPVTGTQMRVQSDSVLSLGRNPSASGRNIVNVPGLARDATISSNHAKIKYTGDGWILEDEGSSNGTATRLSLEREQSAWHELMDGDILGVGCTRIKCKMRFQR